MTRTCATCGFRDAVARDPEGYWSCATCMTPVATYLSPHRFVDALRERRVTGGLCRNCGRHPHAEGRQSCRACLDKYEAYNRRRREEREARRRASP
jgi:hypothetical protein